MIIQLGSSPSYGGMTLKSPKSLANLSLGEERLAVHEDLRRTRLEGDFYAKKIEEEKKGIKELDEQLEKVTKELEKKRKQVSNVSIQTMKV